MARGAVSWATDEILKAPSCSMERVIDINRLHAAVPTCASMGSPTKTGKYERRAFSRYRVLEFT